jgi:hypothetical protein
MGATPPPAPVTVTDEPEGVKVTIVGAGVLHTPPPVPSDNVIGTFWHIVVGPLMEVGVGLTVTTVEAEQPPAII